MFVIMLQPNKLLFYSTPYLPMYVFSYSFGIHGASTGIIHQMAIQAWGLCLKICLRITIYIYTNGVLI